MNVWVYAIGSIVFISLLSLGGVFTLALNPGRLKQILLYLVSFAVGGLYGDAFIHLIPEAFRKFGIGMTPCLYILGGIFLFFLVEKTIRWSQDSISESINHVHPLVPMMLTIDATHNFIDGLVIGASYSVSIPIGIATSLAVIFHEIPHEIGDFAVLVHGGFTVKKALIFNFLTALTSILGAIISLSIGSALTGYSEIILPITAGGFIYIAGSDLIPELQKDNKFSKSFWQLACIVAGTGIMVLLLMFEK